MKKILMLTMSLGIGGAETHVLELARGLSAKGHEVTVASKGGVFVEPLTESGVTHLTVPLHTKNPFAMAKAYAFLHKHLKENRYDVIHAHARIPALLGHMLSRQFDVPFVTTCHLNFRTVWYYRLLTRTGERALSVSEDLRNYLHDNYGMDKAKIDVTVNGINTDAFSEKTEPVDLPLPAGERIVTVTRIDRQCASYVYQLIYAMPKIVKERPDARLVIVGGGDVLEEIRALAAETDAALGGGRILVTGPRSDIARILPTADVFVGVSRAAMEAMAARVPVILTGHQGHLGIFTEEMLPDAVATNFCCRGRTVGTSADIARDVVDLLSRPKEERRALGDVCRRVIETYYSVSRMAGDAERLYEKAIRDHVPKAGDVLITGYYGFGNAGDDALLSALASGLHDRGIGKIAALAKRGATLTDGVRPVSRFNPFAVLSAMSKAKLLLFGGGSLLQDATSTRSLMYYASILRLAALMKVPTAVVANGIGPIRSRRNEKIAARALSKALWISVRDEASKAELLRMGVPREKILLSADPVYRTARCAEETAPKNRLLVSLREFVGKTKEDALSEVTVALSRICRDFGLEAVFLPMQPSEDTKICRQVAALLRAEGVDARLSEARDAEAILSEIRSSRAVLAMRLHALIFATAAAVPSAAISYDPKVDALMEYLGLSHRLAPAPLTAAGVESLLRDLLESRDDREKLLARTAEFAQLAKEDLDRVVALPAK